MGSVGLMGFGYEVVISFGNCESEGEQLKMGLP
jgi:hypothetical protein